MLTKILFVLFNAMAIGLITNNGGPNNTKDYLIAGTGLLLANVCFFATVEQFKEMK
jgi:hypothetical protein